MPLQQGRSAAIMFKNLFALPPLITLNIIIITSLIPKQGDSHKDDSGSEDARPTTGGKSLSAMGGSSGGGEAAKTGLSDDSDQEEAIQSGEKSAKRKVLDDESEEDDVGNDGEKNSQEAGKTGLSDSDSDDGAPSKKGVEGDGDTEMVDRTHRDVFGESDSDDEGAASGDVAKERAEKVSDKHKGQKVLLNKETGQLERGPVEDAPEHAIQDSQVGRDRRAIQKDTLKLSFPALPRPPSNAKLYYLKLPKRHLIFDHTPCGSVQEEAAKIAGDTSREGYSESASFVRWRYKGSEKESAGYLERDKETNARFVEWSDGSITLQVGPKHIEVKQQALEKNSHHLYVKHAEAKKVNSKGELEEEVVIQGHGVLEARMLLKPATDDTSRKVLASLSKLYGRKKIDRDSMFVRNTQADNLALQEAARIRNESRKEGARRKAGPPSAPPPLLCLSPPLSRPSYDAQK
jgi:hypothetical protein